MVGQHIRALKGGRWIHAIDCGDETVLHLVDEAPQRVRRAYRPEFVAGSASVEVITHRERTFPAKEIVRRAYSRASDPALAAMFRDSEAFAEWCATGRLVGPRNVALEVPGVAPAAPAKPAAAKAAPKAPAAKAAPKKSAKPAQRKPAKRSATAARKAAPARKARPAAKKAGKAKGGKARKASAPARRGASKKRSRK